MTINITIAGTISRSCEKAMYLTKAQEKMLENPRTEKCMKLLLAMGKVFEAERLIEVKSVHISGISYQNIGEAGLEWIEELSNLARFRVKATVNPAGMDLERWREMGISEEFYEKQMRVLKALEKMGAKLEMSCIPYHFERLELGDHLAWAESNAVIYANSVVGARTNRESGITAIASAVTGFTPEYGMHLEENRRANVIVKIKGDFDAALAGCYIGRILKEETPLVCCNRKMSREELKAIGAAMAATGGKAIFHVKGQTPEWNKFDLPDEKIEVDAEEIKAEIVGSIEVEEVDLIAIGCPHVYKDEIMKIARFAEKNKFKREFWVFTARRLLKDTEVAKAVEVIERAGGKVFCDTCMVVSPATERFECVMVNSGKALTYLPKLRGVGAVYGTLDECLRVGVS